MTSSEREKWLQERRRGIGGSDAPAICGVSPWRTPYQVWLDKRGEADPAEDNDAMFWGRTLEPVVRQRYADVTGREVVVPGGVIAAPDLPWMLASLDGIAEVKRVLEVKTARSSDGWGDPGGGGEIPEPYAVQVQHYLRVTGYEWADVAVLIGGNDFRIYSVPADAGLQAAIVEREAEFWEMVQSGTPPDPVSMADARLRYGTRSEPLEVQASPEAVRALDELRRLREAAKGEDALKAVVMAELGEADTLVHDGKVLATWKQAKGSKRFDAAALKSARPEVWAEFIREAPGARRFLIK